MEQNYLFIIDAYKDAIVDDIWKSDFEEWVKMLFDDYTDEEFNIIAGCDKNEINPNDVYEYYYEL